MSETKLLVRFRTKIDWLNYKDWETSNTFSFDQNDEGLYVANKHITQLFSKHINKNGLVEKGKKYRIYFILGPNTITGEYSGGVKITIGGKNTVTSTFNVTSEDVEHTTYIDSETDTNLFNIESFYYSDEWSLKDLVIEEIGYTVLDTFQDSKVLLNYQFKDIQEPESIEGNYTKQIKLPGSKSNNRFFKYIFNINEDSIFNMAGRCDAVIQVDDQTLEEGFIKLEDIIGIDDFRNYTITFYGQNVSLFNKIGDDTFEDLDFSDLNHTLTKSTVVNSWSNFNNFTSNYVYPYIDYGGGDYILQGEIGAGTDTSYSGLICGDLYPAISIKYIIDKIFDKYDATYTSDIFTSDNFKRMILPFGQSEEKLKDWSLICTMKPDPAGSLNNAWICYNNTNRLNTDGTWKTGVYLQSKNNNHHNGVVSQERTNNGNGSLSFGWSDDVDIYNRFNDYFTWQYPPTNTTGEYRLPGTYKVLSAGKYRIKMKFAPRSHDTSNRNIKVLAFKFHYDDIDTISPVQISLNNSDTVDLMGTWNINQNFSGGYGIFTGELDCDEGDMIGVKVFTNTNTYMVLYIDWNFGLQIEREEFSINNSVNMNLAKPNDIKIKDFLKGINNLFNLTYTTDPNNINNYIIEPYIDYFTDYGTSRDWTRKIDRDSEIKVELPKDYLSLYYNFKYKDADDYWNSYWDTECDQYGLGFGGKRIRVDNDFISDEKNIQTIFEPSPLITPASSNYHYHTTRYEKSKYPRETGIYQHNTEIGLRLLYFQPLSPYGSGTFRFEYSNYASYPYAGHVLNPDHQEYSSASNLCYDLDPYINNVNQMGAARYRNSAGNTELTNNNLYNIYWKEYIENLIDKDARIVTAKFKLDINDLFDFQFADKILVDGTYYRVHRIKDFNTDGTELTEVELLKLSDAVVTFVTGSTSADTPPLIQIKPGGSINLGRGNKIKAKSLIIGDNSASGNEKSLIIGDSSSGGRLNIGNSNKSSSGSTIIGNNVKINSGITAVVIDSDITVKEEGAYIQGIKIKDGVISTTNEIEIGGIIEEDGVFNPWKFNDYHIVEEGENGGNILDIYIYEIEAGNIDENPV